MTSPASNRPSGRMTGGRAMAEMLRLHEAGPMFGMGGFQLLPFYEGMRALGLRHFLINDERCGAFAADSYARVSGRPGICDGTLGPGATNLVTPLVELLNAGVPIVAITGDTHRAHSWKNMTQECRQLDILRPAVKDVLRVEQVQRVPEYMRRAFAVATSGRAGPVVLDVPEDVAHGEHEFTADDFHIDPDTLAAPARRTRPAAADLRRAAALLAKAKRPILLVGGGVHLSGACSALQSFVESQAIPVAHTMSGKGSIACTHALSAGLFGRYSRIANELIAELDCILVIGCKLGEIATKRFALIPSSVPLIHLDILPEEIGRTTHADVALWGDAREGLADLEAELSEGAAKRRTARADYIREVGARMEKWRVDATPRYTSAERPINMGRLIGELQKLMPKNGILVADGGFAAHWTGLLYDTKAAGRTYIADRGLASIGYGLPGALGAQLAAPDVAGRRHHRRRRLQHGDRRDGDGAPHRRQFRPGRRQQRGVGLRQGVAARDVQGPLPVERADRDGLRRHRARDGLPRHPRRKPGRSGRGVPHRPDRARQADRDRRRRDPRSGPDAAGGGQPHTRGESGRPAGVRWGHGRT